MEPITTYAMPFDASLAPPPEQSLFTNREGESLEKLLPQIKDLARQVGGYRRLIALLEQLDQGGE